MKKILSIMIIIIIFFSIAGCSNTKSMESINNELEKDTVKNNSIENPEASDYNNISILSKPQNLITYKDNNILLWLEQSIFINKHGDIIEKADSIYGEEDFKTSVVLKYVVGEEMHEINLSELVIEHILKGVEDIIASPSGKYVALEFNSADCHETILIDTANGTAKMLYDNESNKNPMICVSWKYDDDNILAYIPAFAEEEINELKSYNIANKSKKIICKLDDNFTGYSSIIDWNKDNIKIIDVYSSKLIKINTH